MGSESQDLPGFIVFSTGKKGPSGGNSNWGSGFLPTVYQGVEFRTSGDPVLYLSNPRGIDSELQRDSLDAVQKLNRVRLEKVGDPEIATRINSFEMAFRMQQSAPDVNDISHEPPHILEMYGAEPGKPSFANTCLLARRLLEPRRAFRPDLPRGRGTSTAGWCAGIEGPAAPRPRTQRARRLVKDLKHAAVLRCEDTLVVWGGEFGRTPMVQGGNDGRDHHPNCILDVAGRRRRKARACPYGECDELRVFRSIEDKVHIHDLQATILHLLGLDHLRLTMRFQGRDFRLTDVEDGLSRDCSPDRS